MIRPRFATILLAVLALAPGCSSKSSAPSAAHGSAEVQSEAPGQAMLAPASSEVAPASPEPAAGSAPMPEAERSDGAESAAPGGSARKAKDDALAGSRLIIAEPKIGGGLDRDIIRRKASDHDAELRACHAHGLVGDPSMAGTVSIKLKVDARGVVEDVELGRDSDLDDREVVDCILALVSKWSFAGEATAAATVELNLELSPAQ